MGALIVGGCGSTAAIPARPDAGFDVASKGQDAPGDAGAAGTGGGTGGADSAIGGVGGTAGAADCVDLSRAPVGRFDFRVVGSGFDAYEGELVRAVVVNGNHPGYGLGQTTIRNGSFEIVLPKTNEPYTGYGVYIDRGGDDACTVNVDPFFQMTSGGVYQDVNWEINPQTRYLQGLPPCNIDGIFDLTQPLPCQSSASGATDGGADTGGVEDGGGGPEDASIVDVNDTNPSDGVVIEAGQQTAACLAKHTWEYSIVFEGSGFPAFEGKTVVLMTTDSTTDNRCRTIGSVQIHDGAFRAEVFNLTSNNYPFMGAFIDLGGDGHCSGGVDPSWTTIFTLTQRQVVAPITAKDFKVSATCGLLLGP
jgi:hypothetical protein